MTMDRITSVKNPMIRDLRALGQRKARLAQGAFLVEGEKMIREALGCGLAIRDAVAMEAHEAFLAELDGFETNRNSQVFMLLATNRPWLIDSAVMRSGRIGAAVYVGLPDAETRKAIISAALRDVPLAEDVSIDELVSVTEGYSGAELSHGDGGGVCNVAEQIAGRRWIERRERVGRGSPEWSRVEKVTRDDFLAAAKSITPVSAKDPDIVKKNLEFSFGEGAASAGRDDDDE